MSLKYFFNKNLIPKDSSEEKIEKFYKDVIKHDLSAKLNVYPDVHYKRLAPIPNGIMLLSKNNIYSSFLGVPNCGFTFGKIENITIKDIDKIRQTSKIFSKNLKDYNRDRKYLFSDSEILNILEEKIDIYYKKNKECFKNLKISKKMLNDAFKTNKILNLAKKSLGTMGGGNHFFEIQKVNFSSDKQIKKDEIILLLHSDSVEVGVFLEMVFSNSYMFKGLRKIKNYLRQMMFFRLKLIKDFSYLKNMFDNNNSRKINKNSKIAKDIILYFSIGQIFGEINREIIIKKYINYLKQELPEANFLNYGSHSHDFVKPIMQDGEISFLHANGVQYIGKDKYLLLPGALGTKSYILKNIYNKDAFYSTNHGVGRIQDKHIAKENYSEEEVKSDLKLELLRIGSGKIEEQSNKAFKDVSLVIEEMEKFKLGEKIVELEPIISIKG